jgi:hypothetical protein
MKTIQNIIDSSLYNQVKRTIINENKNKQGTYHITCEGELIDTFNTEEDAKSYLNIYKKDHPEKEFIIEKTMYGSYSEMIDRMENIKENKETKIMKKNKREVRSIAEATLDAKERGLKEFKIGGEIYDVKKTWKLLSEEEMEYCEGCGEKNMEESNAFILAADSARDKGEKEFEFPKGSGKKHKVKIKKDIDLKEDKTICEKCGDMLNEKHTCDKCESKKTKLKLNEGQLISLINKIVTKTMYNESIHGIEITKRSQKTSGTDSKSHMSDVEKKMKKTLSFDGNDNPEFPKQIGKGEKVAHRNTKEEEETIEDYRGGGLEDLNYDYEPSSKFKDRLKKSLKGDSTMGNSQDSPNVMKSDLGEKILKKIDRKAKKIGNETLVSWGTAIKEPIVVKENEDSVGLNDEMGRMKEMFKYNKKTQ